jgi:hypothetical protein
MLDQGDLTIGSLASAGTIAIDTTGSVTVDGVVSAFGTGDALTISALTIHQRCRASAFDVPVAVAGWLLLPFPAPRPRTALREPTTTASRPGGTVPAGDSGFVYAGLAMATTEVLGQTQAQGTPQPLPTTTPTAPPADTSSPIAPVDTAAEASGLTTTAPSNSPSTVAAASPTDTPTASPSSTTTPTPTATTDTPAPAPSAPTELLPPPDADRDRRVLVSRPERDHHTSVGDEPDRNRCRDVAASRDARSSRDQPGTGDDAQPNQHRDGIGGDNRRCDWRHLRIAAAAAASPAPATFLAVVDADLAAGATPRPGRRGSPAGDAAAGGLLDPQRHRDGCRTARRWRRFRRLALRSGGRGRAGDRRRPGRRHRGGRGPGRGILLRNWPRHPSCNRQPRPMRRP